ncbi:MAG: cadherin-like domain-containing protein, partial [Phycisphaeraceae bacterium]
GSFEVFNGSAWVAGTVFTSAQLAAGEVRFVDDGDEVAPAFSVTANDGTANSNTLAATVTYTPANDAPVLNAVQLTVSEGATTVLAAADFNVTDPDSGAFTYTVSGVAGGSFEVFNGASWNAQASFTTAQLAAGEVRFVDDGNEVGPSFSVTASDGTASSNTLAATVTYTAVNDAPVLNAAALDVSQGQTATLSGVSFSITDPDDANFTYTASGVTGGYFQLSSNAGVAITSFTSADLAGGLVQFVDDGNALAPAFSVTVNDGDVDSNTLAATINYTAAAPDAPVVDLNAGGAGQDVTVAFTEQTPVLIAPAGTLTDTDSANLTSLTITLMTRPDGDAAESLSLNAAAATAVSGAGLTVGYTASSGVLSITGSASVATYQTILQGIQYNNTSDTPSTSNRAVTVAANDGALPSLTQTSTAMVTAANDAPVLDAVQLTVSEGATTVPAPADFNITDPDSGAFTYTVSGVAGGSFEVLAGASWNAQASFTTAQLAAGEVRFVDDGNEVAPSFSVTANDGALDSNTLAATVTYTALNDAPVASASSGTAAFAAGGSAVAVDAGLAVSDADSATLAGATVSIGAGFQAAEDALAFTNNPATMGNIAGSYNAATGVLSLSSAGATATLVQWQAALNSVTYTNTSAAPSTATRAVSFELNDGAAVSPVVTVAVSVAAPAAAPTPSSQPPAETTPPPVVVIPPAADPVLGLPAPSTPVAAPAQPSPAALAPGRPSAASGEATSAGGGEIELPTLSAQGGAYLQSLAAGGAGVPGFRLAAHGIAAPAAEPADDLLADVFKQVDVRALDLFQLAEQGGSAAAEGLAGDLARLRESVREQDEIQQRTVVVLAAGSLSMTLGYLLWLVRGGALAASVLASLPAWRLIDPLPILSRLQDRETDESDESDEEEDETIAAFSDAPADTGRA